MTYENAATQDNGDIFYLNEPTPFDSNSLYKIYNDGGHYIATPYSYYPSKKKKTRTNDTLILLFDYLYDNGIESGLDGDELIAYIKAGILKEYPNFAIVDSFILNMIERKNRNLYARKKRFKRKANMNKWNYFVTLTYDSSKMDEETFEKKLKNCLNHLHSRRGWRYMGVFEHAPETGRLHFHGLFYIPNGEMIGEVEEIRDYSTAQKRMQTRHENDFFEKRFGRNDFEELNDMALKHGNTIKYLLKYIEKAGEHIVYSRGIPSEIYRNLDEDEIVTQMQDFITKFILFDNVLTWERDIKHYNNRLAYMQRYNDYLQRQVS